MDHDLPQFEPVGLPPPVSNAEILRERQIRSGNSEIGIAEALCLAGNVSAATADINRLLETGTHVQDLQFCLLGAVLSESQDLVRTLLDAGVPACLSNVKPAIEQKSLPILSLFLQHGWNINEREDWCLPPLLSYAVATEPDESLVSWFLNNGADPNARCEMDITPLSIAVECAPLSIIEQLFAHHPSGTSLHGQLLHWAARRTADDAEDVLQLVLNHCQPDLNKTLYEDDAFSYEVRKVVGLGTALHEAARYGRPSVVQMLLQKGIDVSIRDSCGNTALEVAERCENDAAVAMLRLADKGMLAKM